MLESLLGHEATTDLLPQAQPELRQRMVDHTEEIEQLLPYIESGHIPFVIANLSQRAVNTSQESEYENMLSLEHKLYSKLADTDKPQSQQSIVESLISGVSRYPSVARTYSAKRFITPEQRQNIKGLLDDYEASLSNTEE